jgi:hypothetical protein
MGSRCFGLCSAVFFERLCATGFPPAAVGHCASLSSARASPCSLSAWARPSPPAAVAHSVSPSSSSICPSPSRRSTHLLGLSSASLPLTTRCETTGPKSLQPAWLGSRSIRPSAFACCNSYTAYPLIAPFRITLRRMYASPPRRAMPAKPSATARHPPRCDAGTLFRHRRAANRRR